MTAIHPNASYPRGGLRFCLLFACYTVVIFLVLYALHVPVVIPFTRVIARLSHTILQTLGANAWVAGASVGIPGFAVEIKNNCNAIYEIGLYGAAVVAYPASWRERTLGFAHWLRSALSCESRPCPGPDRPRSLLSRRISTCPPLPLAGPLPRPRCRLLAYPA